MWASVYRSWAVNGINTETFTIVHRTKQLLCRIISNHVSIIRVDPYQTSLSMRLRVEIESLCIL